MKILDAVMRILGLASPNLIRVDIVLKAIAAKYPDAAEELAPIIAALEKPVDPVELGTSVVGEGWEILKGNIAPRRHPGDAI